MVAAPLFLSEDWTHWTVKYWVKNFIFAEKEPKKITLPSFFFGLINLYFCFFIRKKGCDTEPGELHLQVSRDHGAPHPPRRARAAAGALHQAAHRQVGHAGRSAGADSLLRRLCSDQGCRSAEGFPFAVAYVFGLSSNEVSAATCEACFIDERVRPGPSRNGHRHVPFHRQSHSSLCLPGSAAKLWPLCMMEMNWASWHLPVSGGLCSPAHRPGGASIPLLCGAHRTVRGCSVSRLAASLSLFPQTPSLTHPHGNTEQADCVVGFIPLLSSTSCSSKVAFSHLPRFSLRIISSVKPFP